MKKSIQFAEALAAQGCNIMLNGLGDLEAIEQRRASLAERHGVDVICRRSRRHG